MEVKIGTDNLLVTGFQRPFYFYLSLFNYKNYRLKKKDTKWERVFFAFWFGYHRFINQFGEGWEIGLRIFDRGFDFRKLVRSGYDRHMRRTR